MNITIIGTGNVGLVTGACLADLGNHVFCLDVDQAKIDLLNSGGVPIYEPGLKEVIERNVVAGRLSFSTDVAASVAHGNVQFIAVGNPPDENGSADLQDVLAAARNIGRYMLDGKVVVGKSTVPLGTADKVSAAINQELAQRFLFPASLPLPLGEGRGEGSPESASCPNFSVVSNPEFLKESPRRGETFVTRKITRGLANVSLGLEDCLYMGNIDALRDWGHAKDYVRMQWMMLQQTEAEDFVIATGKQYSVRQFIEWTAAELGMQLRWEGEGIHEKGFWLNPPAVLPRPLGDCRGEGIPLGARPIVSIDPRYFRPTEVETLLGDPSKAKQKLGWVPEITAQEMCTEMVAHDLAQAKQHALLKANGYQVNVSVE